MTGAHGLTGEELEALGGAVVVARYGLERGQVAGMLLLGGLLSVVGFGGVLLLRQRFGLAPWARVGEQSLFDLATFTVVFGGYALAWSQAVWFLVLSAWRSRGASPALVAGAHGLRAHGTWPWPRALAWEDVRDVTASGHVLLVAPAAVPSRLTGWFGSPLRVPLAPGVDAAALVASLRTLRAEALAGAPPSPAPGDGPVR
ncbi:MAG: hypothetical protein KF878_29460 [Planctomycetes bacterium]|nr:hypothetical protein [Planctomycetota bacterium]